MIVEYGRLGSEKGSPRLWKGSRFHQEPNRWQRPNVSGAQLGLLVTTLMSRITGSFNR